ncbi:MAG TPA: hypothetical protein G4O12_00390 [Dehalococcoidia bacterium]|nr:hypothetical protein [Dehalococcoidia bacterium]
MRVVRGCLTVLGIIGVIVIIALVIGYCLFSLTPSIESEMTPVVVTAEAAQSFDQKFQTFETEIEAAVATGEEKEVSLVITEEEVNSKLVEVLAEGELPLKEALLNFDQGYFLVYAVVDTPGVDAKTAVIARIEVVKGEPKVTVEDFDLGKLLLPQGMNNGIGSLLTIIAKMNAPTDDLPLVITEIEIAKGQLSVKGVTKTAG